MVTAAKIPLGLKPITTTYSSAENTGMSVARAYSLEARLRRLVTNAILLISADRLREIMGVSTYCINPHQIIANHYCINIPDRFLEELLENFQTFGIEKVIDRLIFIKGLVFPKKKQTNGSAN